MSDPPSYMIASLAAFRKGDMPGALAAAEMALSDHADHLPLLALASLAALQMSEPARAIPYLRHHHELVPEDMAVRSNLATALAETGDRTTALELATGQAHHGLARLEAYLQQEQGNEHAAIAAYRRAVTSQPGDMQSWNNLGNLLAKDGAVDEAIAAFEQAITIAPEQISIYLNLSDLLAKAEQTQPRLVVTRAALEQAPDDPDVLTEHALALISNEQHDAAVDLLQQAVDNVSKQKRQTLHAAHIELAILLEMLNRLPDLSALVSRCVDDGMADSEIAFLKAWMARRHGDFEAASVWAAKIPDSISPLRVAQLRADIADRLGHTGRAFNAFVAMNAAAISESGPPHLGPSFRQQVSAETRHWTAPRLQALAPDIKTDDYRDPVFIVGFPRSGTTLLDTILMGIPDLYVMEEMPILVQASQGMSGNTVSEWDAEQIRAVRARYFNLVAPLVDDAFDRRVVDKHPLHMAKMPLIYRLFPKAQIILAERHPMDVVLSCFMANFKLNHAMRSFTSLDEAAKTFDTVFESWANAEELLPLNVKRVRYERLIADPAKELRPIVEWLGLEWSDAFLDHRKTAAARGRIKTASYSQVTEPIYKRAINRWHRYRDYLAPIEPTLAPWVKSMGYDG